ncbi:MAG TPA: family 10 glycosylhydrolase [Anaerolineae bacterium]|nr:family 10 glycosylhydrolase [Anaerolineae bacterium]
MRISSHLLTGLILITLIGLNGCAPTRPLDPTAAPEARALPTLPAASGTPQARSTPSPHLPVPLRPAELRGAWVDDSSIWTRAKVDETLRQAEAAHLNTLLVNVFTNGHALFETDLAPLYPRVERGFNPLAYLVDEAHRRNIAIHAWFVNGPVSFRGASPLIDRQPEWAIVGPDGKRSAWLNFTRPDVRQFLSDLMWETVAQYHVDGLHFDYTRYPGPEWGFDTYSAEAFSAASGVDLDELKYTSLPAYGPFSGRPLVRPTTAQVLATFSNGVPAITLNTYGQGETVLLNWDATERKVGIGAEIMQRSLRRLLNEGGQVYLLQADTFSERSGEENFEQGRAWLNDLDWPPLIVNETDIDFLPSTAALVIPNVPVIPDEAVAQLADFVQRGGGLIVINGIARSIQQPALEAVIGLQARGEPFKADLLMTANGAHPLVPTSQRPTDVETYRALDAQWKAFRQQGINALVEGVYRRVKAEYPQVEVSVTVTSDQTEATERVLQDWRAWMDGGYIDLLIPRAYVDNVAQLHAVIEVWQPEIQRYGRVTLGLIALTKSAKAPKPPEQLVEEVELARAAGSSGFMLFVLGRMNAEQLTSLGAALSAAPAPAASRSSDSPAPGAQRSGVSR